MLEIVCNDAQKVVLHLAEHPVYGRYSVRDWHLINTNMRAFITHPVLVNALKSLAGVDLVIWRSKIFHKKSYQNGTGWHQEWGDFDGEELGNRKPSLKPIALLKALFNCDYADHRPFSGLNANNIVYAALKNHFGLNYLMTISTLFGGNSSNHLMVS
ncbi:hypothetical protein ACPV47_18545 [Vibrio jasicida]|uniref:hypothetical protein n=1 Tax=Vibrio jasicida TaxID=766224 RepID=UPI0040682E30